MVRRHASGRLQTTTGIEGLDHSETAGEGSHRQMWSLELNAIINHWRTGRGHVQRRGARHTVAQFIHLFPAAGRPKQLVANMMLARSWKRAGRQA